MHLLLKWWFSRSVSIIWGLRWSRYGLPQSNNVLSLFKAYHPSYCVYLPRLESCTWGSAARQFLGSESRDAKNATVADMSSFFTTKKPTPQKNEMITSNLPDPWRWSEPPLSGRSLKAVPTHTILQTTSDKNDSGFWSLLMCVMNFQQHLGSRSDVNESNIQKCTEIQI